MTKEDLMAEMNKGGSTPAPAKPSPKAPPKLKQKPQAQEMKVMGGNPFDGAREMMMDQMGGEMNQGLDVVVNGEPMSSPDQIADFVVNTPELLDAVKMRIDAAEDKTEGEVEED